MAIFYRLINYVKENYFYILLLLISFLQYRKTGNIFLGAREKMLYKTEKDLYNSAKQGQDFTGSHLVKTWRLNANGVLEETGDIVDMDELINSNRDTCLASVLAKFQEIEAGITKVDNENISKYATMQDDLLQLGSLMDKAEELRDRYGLDNSLTTMQVFDAVKEKSNTLNSKIKHEQEKLQLVKDIKGGLDNEKKNFEENK